MIKLALKGLGKQELTKAITAAAEKQITEVARRAAAPHGGVRLRFRHKSDGSVASIDFKGSEKAILAARNALAS